MDADVTLTAASPGWRDAYVRARHREGRLLPDALVAQLPIVPRDHPLLREWRARQDSCARLVRYLRIHPRLHTVLDAGCGNGWLAARMAALSDIAVVGVDVSVVELDQARRVFREVPNLTFLDQDLLSAPLPGKGADIVVLASVIQYLPYPARLVSALLDASRVTTEVHVLDSPIYESTEIPGARARTERHYTGIGVPEMAAAYNHHDWRAFDGLSMDVLYRPSGAWRRLDRHVLRRARSPFPWLRFRRPASPP